MIVTIANLLIVSSIVFGFIAIIIPEKKFFFLVQSGSIIFSVILLLVAFITSDFSVQNVLFYSSTLQPLVYKIGGLWANHNASLLFWTALLAAVTMIAVLWENDTAALSVITKIFSVFLVIMIGWIYIKSNPFIFVESPPKEGLGLNPVLQDIALSIHPPILYLGYVTYIVPFAYSIVILVTASAKMNYLKTSLFFSKIALCALTSGIALGSWWAYRELGWGGYWFFDPVENISLIPWLTGIAMHHSMIISVRTKGLIKTSLTLGLLNFILMLFGVMLVRSGSLVSVHAFASNLEGGIYLALLFGLGIVCTMALSFVRIHSVIGNPEFILGSSLIKPPKQLQNDGGNFITISTKAISYGVILLLLAVFSILVGILYPYIYEFIMGNNITIDNGYFHAVFLPIAVLIVILCSVISVKNLRNAAMVISHSGIFILTIGILLNSLFKQDIEFIGQIGDKSSKDNYTIKLQNIRYALGPNYYRQIAELWVEKDHMTTILKPENRLYKVEDKISAESDIYSFVTKDLYAVLGAVEENNTVHANIYIRPWMSLIWLGMFLTASGLLVSIVSKKI